MADQLQDDQNDDGNVDIAALAADADTQAAPVDPFEELAREKGWAPKEDWRGNPDEWRDAKSFISYGMDRGKDAGRELREVRHTVDRIAKTADGMQRRAVEEARREVEARFAQAVEDKDHDGARAARDELNQIERQSTQPTGGPAPVVQDFVARNAHWFNVDPAATQYAVGFTDKLAKQGLPHDEQIRQVEAEMRQRFPEHFTTGSTRPAPKPSASVSEPTSRVANVSPRAKGVADLPAEARRAGADFVKRGMAKTLEDYAKIYFEENA